MRNSPSRRFLVLSAVLFAAACFASPASQTTELMVDQKDKQFHPQKLKVKAGDSVKFVNSDSYFHNVFSLSDAKTFDLGSYPQGQSRSVKFDTPGVIEVECAIHPGMKMTITVEKK
jgi:plastocyanin